MSSRPDIGKGFAVKYYEAKFTGKGVTEALRELQIPCTEYVGVTRVRCAVEACDPITFMQRMYRLHRDVMLQARSLAISMEFSDETHRLAKDVRNHGCRALDNDYRSCQFL